MCQLSLAGNMGEVEMEIIHTRLRRYTFEVKKIKQWVENQCTGKVLNLFAGMNRLDVDEVRNDLDENADADYHFDALFFVRSWDGEPFDTVIVDPPYSIRKSMEMYEGRKVSQFKLLADELPRIIKKGGKIITFGYHSTNLGQGRGFDLERMCVFAHGGQQHCTIGIVEVCKRD
jgi:hypothetical protein